jgi:AcrR family transcriptional regulator
MARQPQEASMGMMGLLHMPGSPVNLLLINLIFLTKCYFGVRIGSWHLGWCLTRPSWRSISASPAFSRASSSAASMAIGASSRPHRPERPPEPARKRYHHGDLRGALVRAAEALLEEVGPDRLTLREAARRADVSHAAPAHHFRDLTGLLSEVAASGFERLAGAVAGSAEAARLAGEDELSATGRAYLAFALEHPGLFQLMFRSQVIDMKAPHLEAASSAAFGAFAAASHASGADAGGGETLTGMAALVRNWAMVHGLAFLAIDGRLAGLLPAGATLADLIDAILAPPPAKVRPGL